MPCFSPLQASYTMRDDGKKDIKFSKILAKNFYEYNSDLSDFASVLSLPCSKCIGCRLEKSRQVAVRCMHEASMYDRNSFITLTYSPDKLKELCPTGSLNRSDIKSFMRRVQYHYDNVRSYYCGEYGDKLGRPHYHAAMFNLDFDDKEYWKTVNGCAYYVSPTLTKLWGNGFTVIGDLTFESAAYIARYCTKKITGEKAKEHYSRVLADTGEVVQLMPEFAQGPKTGLGRPWLEKYGMSDVFLRDEVAMRGVLSKPPRYYDKFLEKLDPSLFLKNKSKRDERRKVKLDDNLYSRLLVKEKCVDARMKRLVRVMDREAFA